jgi:antitoxin ParD1/3/4
MASSGEQKRSEGTRLIQEREAMLVALDSAIARGLNDAEDRRVKPARDVFRRLEAKYSRRVGKGAL